MPNLISKTEGYVSKRIGLGMYNSSVIVPLVDTQYSPEYGSTSGGAKVGNQIKIRFPAKFVATNDTVISAGTIQAIIEEEKYITLDTNVSVFTDISTEEATLDIETEGAPYSKRVLEPIGKALVAKVETEVFKEIALNADNAIIMETPFADAEVLRQNFVKMRSYLDMQLAEGDYSAIMNSRVEMDVANSVIPLFHNQKQVDSAFLKGTVTEFGNMAWRVSNLVYTRVNGAGGTAGLTVTAYTEGSESLTISDATGFVVGDKIEIAGVNMVNAESKADYGIALQRAVKAINGNVLTIDPIWGPTSKGQQNATAVPAATNAVTVLGTAGETYLCCPVITKRSTVLGSADLVLPKSQEMAKRDKVNGVAYSFVKGYDITDRTYKTRAEALIGVDVVRPEWCGVIEMKIS